MTLLSFHNSQKRMQSNRVGVPTSQRGFAKVTQHIRRLECTTVAPKLFQSPGRKDGWVESKGRAADELARQRGALRARKPSPDEGPGTKDGVQGTCATCHPPLCPLALCMSSSVCQETVIRLCGNTPREIYRQCNQQSANLSCFNLETK